MVWRNIFKVNASNVRSPLLLKVKNCLRESLLAKKFHVVNLTERVSGDLGQH